MYKQLNTFKMKEKKLELSPYIYITIMIIVFLLGSCNNKKRIVPTPKYTPGHHIGL